MKLEGSRFLVVGRAGVDFYPDPPGTRTEDGARFFACLGGSAANIAVAITRLGGTASLVTRVSDDALGRLACNQLDHYGVDRRHVQTAGGEARTSLAVVETRMEDHQSIIYRNGAADLEMTEGDLEGIDFGAFDAMILTGTVLAAEPSRGAGFAALEAARAAGVPVLLDIDHRPYSWPSDAIASEVYGRAAAMCDVIVGNDLEFGILAGHTESGLAAARDLVARGARIAVYKMGERGAITVTPEGEVQTGIYRAEALKPTGAGDSFMGGFAMGLADGLSVTDAVRQGSASAAMVVARVGCAPAMPTRAELDDFMHGNRAPSPNAVS